MTGRLTTLAILAAFLSASLARAQEDRVTELARLVWSGGADSALAAFDRLPGTERKPALLLSLSDQLLWTGRTADATRLLARAADDGPRLAEVRFQQGRAALLTGKTAEALAAFRAGLELVDRDRTLDDDSRAATRNRLTNRVALLERHDALLARTGAYRRPDGGLLFFRFDPYLNVFPSLLDPATGLGRVLYPAADGALEWRDDDGAAIGWLGFEGEPDGDGAAVLRAATGTTRATRVPIEHETIRFDAAGASIEGTLFRPAGPGPVPAVVLTHGAGLSTRYNLVSEALAYAAAGVAALVYDKPGLGRSTGANWLLLSIDDQVGYVLAAAARLRARPDIARVGVWGFSQGGWVGPVAAARDDSIAFVVMASGAAVSPQGQHDQSLALRLRASELSGTQVDSALQHQRATWSRVNAGARIAEIHALHARIAGTAWGRMLPRFTYQWELDWWRGSEVDPGPSLRALRVPVLAIFGEKDAVVPPDENVPLLARYLAEAPTGDYTIAVLPGASHQLMVGDGYEPRYFSTMVDWVARRFGRRR